MKRITLESEVMVSDPCYSDETWCQVKLKNVLPGPYLTTVKKTNDTYWGNRCSVLLAVHEDYVEDTLTWRNYPGEVGVDSGQAGIFSMSTYKNDEIASSITSPDKTYDGRPFTLGVKDRPGDEWYEKMCQFTLSPESWGSYDTGVVSSSGIGDGGYRCLVAKHKGKIVGIAIDFYMEKFPNKFINDIINEHHYEL
jgi:hypothetical protein